ncbi:Hpt domain-containing response regulator [Tunturiibacter gelidoferens]|uniref:CheY-like chemotaxis protein n=2 Tax=Tunturiibacter TaxID=3154218 RepID=A0A7Y9NPV2_9BACT|nr:response regulator [Edaphobacter lichenicola]MBB5341920.1 CheY-like chemotaxis protein [Edaphobacter lichenicola]NYF53301.1 CheY-like chemotaxis protein [Edaphobacter lichenicola]
MPVRILIVDDDELSREVLMLLAERAGYEVEALESGDAALVHVQRARPLPEVVLTDMQMPGTAGDELARRLRGLCGTGSLLLAMSGSELEDGTGQEFDGFLLKPFTMETLARAISRGSARADEGSSGAKGGVLDEGVYGKLSQSMRRSQLEQLYALCLKDAEARIGKMRRATSDGNDAAYRKEAHAIKGGCGMVGAVELQRLATSMEERGLRDDDVATLDEFMVACERLRRILVARESN